MKNKTKLNHKIFTDQEEFFNQNALHQKVAINTNIFSKYANKEQKRGFLWLSNKSKILDFGVGTGTSIDVFLHKRNSKKYTFYGVDIAEIAVKKARENYPNYFFYKISNNKIPQIKKGSMEGAYMLHVLHHAKEHKKIFQAIYYCLGKDGKFLINDLCSNNPFNSFGRKIFIYMPKFIKNKFGDDLVVGESIPEKYKVSVEKVVKELEDIGFEIKKIEYGHLFFFLFGWLDRFVQLSKISLINKLYKKLIEFEDWLLKFNFFKQYAEVFGIYCVKK